MKNKLFVLFALLTLASLLLAACAPSAPAATPTPTAPPVDLAAGQKAFGSTCASCHGQDAKGMPGLGKDLTTSEFVAAKTDEEMVAFFKVGRPSSDPLNTTGVDMPPKGGNPALKDQDLLNITAYVRSLHGK